MAEPEPYRVELSRQATRAYGRLAAADRARLAKAFDALEHDPRPHGKQVKAIADAERVVLVAAIVARKDLEAWIRDHRG